jgi:hypothetical protein
MKKYIPSINFIASPFKVLPNDCTFTRSSSAYRTNEYGILELINSNEVRHDYDPETGEYLGILLEDALTNKVGDFSTWAYAGSTKNTSISDVVSPDGTLGTNICKICELNTKGVHYTTPAITQVYNNIPGEYYTLSFFVKAAERSEIQVILQNIYAALYADVKRSIHFKVQLNIETGAVLLPPDYTNNTHSVTYTVIIQQDPLKTAEYTVVYTIFANTKISIVKYPNGWRRISVSTKFVDNNDIYNYYYYSRIRPVIYLLNVDDTQPGLRTNSYLGTTGYGVYLWGPQVEYTPSASSYTPSTRAADNLNFDLSTVFSKTEGTIITEFDINSFPYRRGSSASNSVNYPGDTIYQTIFNIHDTTDISKNIGSYIADDAIDYQINNSVLMTDNVVNNKNLKYIHALAYETNNTVAITNGDRLIEYQSAINLSSIADPELSFNYLFKDTYWGTTTNLITYPQTFNIATTWTLSNTTLDMYSAYSKNIVLSRIVETVANGVHALKSTNAITVTASTNYVLKLVLRKAERTSAGVYIETVNAGKYINLTNGTITGNIINSPSADCTVTAFDSQSWLVTIPFSTSGGMTSLKIHIICDDGTAPSASVGATYVGDTSKGIYVGGVTLALASSIDYTTVYTRYSLNGHLKKLYYYKSRLPNSKLKELTT